MALHLVEIGFVVNNDACANSGYVRCPWDVVWTKKKLTV